MGQQASKVAKEGRSESQKYYRLGPKFEKKLAQMVGQEFMILSGRKEDVPLELNQEVLVNLNYLLNDARGFMTRSLTRGQKYIPMMKAIFKQKGLPEDLVYMALIESGFRTDAISTASAVGPWQFISSTGRNYGLTINEWIDERMDPVKSTYAAADYLTDLHDRFNSWPLAIAAYNTGEGKIMKGMQKPEVDNYWDMAKDGFLANETKRYVPSFLAATIIAKDPSAYGLEIPSPTSDGWEEVVVPDPIDLKVAADLTNSSLERLKELNPHLKRLSTPPRESNFVLRVPEGARAEFYRLYAELPSKKKKSSFINYAAKRGESIEQIAAKHGLTTEVVREYNNLGPSAKLSRSQKLVLPSSMPQQVARAVIPQPKTQIQKIPTSSSTQMATVRVPLPVAKEASVPFEVTKRTLASSKRQAVAIDSISHRVRSGDTILSIANLYGVKSEQIKKDNKLASNSIKEGQVLTIRSNLPLTLQTEPKKSKDSWVQVAKGAPIYHTVKKGETISQIASNYSLNQEQIKTLNNLPNNTLMVGQKLRIGTGPVLDPQSSEIYVVKSGDTIGQIADRFGLRSDELRALNDLSGPTIYQGKKLMVIATDQISDSDKEPSTSQSVAQKIDPEKTQVNAKLTSSTVYEVKSGDTLGHIAQRYGLSSIDLRHLNNMDDNVIFPGQKIKVPGTDKVKPELAESSDSPASALELESAAVNKPAIQTKSAAASSSALYEVKSGDTLSLIAQRSGQKVEDLIALNDLKSNVLSIGQKIKVAKAELPKKKNSSFEAQTAVSKDIENSTLVNNIDRVAENIETAVQNQAAVREVIKENLEENVETEGQAQIEAKIEQQAQSALNSVKQENKTASTSGDLYKVQSGDTLGLIAERNGLKTDELKALNDLTGDSIMVGQNLKVSAQAQSSVNRATNTKTVAIISSKTDSTTEKIPQKNVNQSSLSDGSYKVLDGDTIYAIAKKHSLTVEELKALNGKSDDIIRPGQSLKVR
jgi:membrane-bound lytic murein transglycosylase D